MGTTTFEDLTELVGQLSTEDKLRMVEYLAQSLREHQETGHRKDLFGIYRDLVPDNVDIDSALTEIRHAWKEGLFQIES
jgi:hypothetical protein